MYFTCMYSSSMSWYGGLTYSGCVFLECSIWKLLNIVENSKLLNVKMCHWNLPLAGFCLIIWNTITLEWSNHHVHTSKMKPIESRIILNIHNSFCNSLIWAILGKLIKNAILAQFWLVNQNYTAVSAPNKNSHTSKIEMIEWRIIFNIHNSSCN